MLRFRADERVQKNDSFEGSKSYVTDGSPWIADTSNHDNPNFRNHFLFFSIIEPMPGCPLLYMRGTLIQLTTQRSKIVITGKNFCHSSESEKKTVENI